MPRYTHERKDGTPVRRILVELWVSAEEEQRLDMLAKRRASTLKTWLARALREGIDRRVDEERTDEERR